MIRKLKAAVIGFPNIPTNINPSWYAFIIHYRSEDLGGLSLERFYEALQAEGCNELDRPGSTYPLNYHPHIIKISLASPYFNKLLINMPDI